MKTIDSNQQSIGTISEDSNLFVALRSQYEERPTTIASSPSFNLNFSLSNSAFYDLSDDFLIIDYINAVLGLKLSSMADLLYLTSQSLLIPALLRSGIASPLLIDLLSDLRALQLPPLSPSQFVQNHELAFKVIRALSEPIHSAFRAVSPFLDQLVPFDLMGYHDDPKKSALIVAMLLELITGFALSHVSVVLHPQLIVLKREHEPYDDFLRVSPDQLLLRWVQSIIAHYSPAKVPIDWAADFSNCLGFLHILYHINPYCGSPALLLEKPSTPLTTARLLLHRARRLSSIPLYATAESLVTVPCSSRLVIGFAAALFRIAAAADRLVLGPIDPEHKDKMLQIVRSSLRTQRLSQADRRSSLPALRSPEDTSFHCKLNIRSLWTNTRKLYGTMRFERDRCVWVRSYAQVLRRTAAAETATYSFTIPYDQIERIELHKKRAVSFVLCGGDVYHISFFFRNAEAIAQIGNSMHHLVPIQVVHAQPPESHDKRIRSQAFSSSAKRSNVLFRLQLLPQLKRAVRWFDLPCEYAAHVEAEQIFEENMRHFQEANRLAMQALMRDSIASVIPLADDSQAQPGTLYMLTLREASCEFPLEVMQHLPDLPVRVRIRVEEQSEMGMRVKETHGRFKSIATPLPRMLPIHSWGFSKYLIGIWRNRRIRIFFELEAEDQSANINKNHICIGTCWFDVPPLRRRVDTLKLESTLVYSPKMPLNLEPSKTYLHFYFGPYDLWPKDTDVVARPAVTARDDESTALEHSAAEIAWNQTSFFRTDTEVFEAREKLRQPVTDGRLKDRNNQSLTLLYGSFHRLINPLEIIDILPDDTALPSRDEADAYAAARLSHSIDQIHARYFSWPISMPNLEIVAARDASPVFHNITAIPSLQDDIQRLNAEYQSRTQRLQRLHQTFDSAAHLPPVSPQQLEMPAPSHLQSSPSDIFAYHRSPWPVSDCLFFKPRFWLIYAIIFYVLLSFGLLLDGVILFFASINTLLQILSD